MIIPQRLSLHAGCTCLGVSQPLASPLHPTPPLITPPLCRQRLGMRVGRTWAFNSGLPNQPGVYDEEQMEALDFTIYAAGRCRKSESWEIKLEILLWKETMTHALQPDCGANAHHLLYVHVIGLSPLRNSDAGPAGNPPPASSSPSCL